MFVFGDRSKMMLSTCHVLLRAIAHRALELSPIDFAVVQGHRNKDDQEVAFESGKSRVQWPNGRHNSLPSHALDFAVVPNPYEAGFKNAARYYLVAGCFFAAARELGVEIRWGGDWDGDGDFTDQTFDDLGHVEIRHPERLAA